MGNQEKRAAPTLEVERLERPVQPSSANTFVLMDEAQQVEAFQQTRKWKANDMAYPKADLERHMKLGGPLTPALLAVAANLLQGGLSIASCQKALAIDDLQWYRYYDLGRTGEYPYVMFKRIIDLTSASMEMRLVKTWHDAALGETGEKPDWRAAQALLQVKQPQEYNPQLRQKIELQQIQVPENVEVSKPQLTQENLLEVAEILQAVGALQILEAQTIEGEVTAEDGSGS